MDESKAPPLRDPRWEQWSRVVLEYLAYPRDWKSLNAWCREMKFGSVKLRHCLAWLEIHGYVRSFTRDDVLFWVHTQYHGEPEPSPREPFMEN